MTERRGLNVLGQTLQACSTDPMTGWFRDGCCRTDDNDHGRHVVCAVMTDEFLVFSRLKGNDLSTPAPQYGFPGLKAGDRWCLCASRWAQALKAGCAPQVVWEATEMKALAYATLEDYLAHAVAAEA